MIKPVLAGLVIVGLGLLMGRASAASSQGFQILSGQAQQGMIMSQTSNPDVVEFTNSGNLQSMVGVVSPNQSNFDQNSANNVNVQTDGETEVLASTLNGNIVVGDKISGSPLQGVGAKLSGSGWIVGTAEGSLDASTKGAVSSSVVDTKGVKHQVYVALIPVVVHVTYYSSSSVAAAPQSIQNLANNLAGKKVSLAVIVLSVLLFIVGVIAAVVITISAIRSGFLAISRQPLSKLVILREEWRSFAVAVGILVFVMVLSFGLLKFL